MGEKTKSEASECVSNVKSAVADLQRSVIGLRAKFANDITGAHSVWCGSFAGAENPAEARFNEQVALRAYFIGERRQNLGIPGDEISDWVEAEREISEELKVL